MCVGRHSPLTDEVLGVESSELPQHVGGIVVSDEKCGLRRDVDVSSGCANAESHVSDVRAPRVKEVRLALHEVDPLVLSVRVFVEYIEAVAFTSSDWHRATDVGVDVGARTGRLTRVMLLHQPARL